MTLLTFFGLDALLIRNMVLMTTVAVVPLAVLLRLWSNGVPPTVTEAICAAEQGR